jgi:hypothetical protein
MQTPNLANFHPIQFSLLLACGIVPGAHAQGVLIDQSLQIPPFTNANFHYDGLLSSLVPGTGQEFTPSLEGLDFVDVNLQNAIVTDTGTFEIAIHKGNMAAPVLGLSNPVLWSGGFSLNNAHFTFPNTLPIVPGNIYVLEINQLSGDPGWLFEVPVSLIINGRTIKMNYAGGRLIYGGVPQDNYDMLFQEGVFVPEPGVTAFCLLGVLVFGLVRKGTFREEHPV